MNLDQIREINRKALLAAKNVEQSDASDASNASDAISEGLTEADSDADRSEAETETVVPTKEKCSSEGVCTNVKKEGNGKKNTDDSDIKNVLGETNESSKKTTSPSKLSSLKAYANYIIGFLTALITAAALYMFSPKPVRVPNTDDALLDAEGNVIEPAAKLNYPRLVVLSLLAGFFAFILAGTFVQ